MKSCFKLVRFFIVLLLGISMVPMQVSFASPSQARTADPETPPVELWSRVLVDGTYQTSAAAPDLPLETNTTTACNPTAPALASPVNTTVNTLVPSFNWAGQTGVPEYGLEISKTADFTTTVYDGLWHIPFSQISLSLYINLEANTKYYWRVAGYCPDTRTNGPFSTASFNVGNVPSSFINPPAINSPADGAMLPLGDFNLSWGDAPGANGVQTTFYRSLENVKSNNFWTKSWGEWHTSSIENYDNLAPVTIYWTIQVKNNNGWSQPSPLRSFHVGSFAYDMRFRPNPQGYNFVNYGGYSPNELTLDDMIRMFDRTTVCANSSGICIPKVDALAWLVKVNWKLGGGHCLGMSSTSANYFKNPSQIGQVKAGATAAYQLDQPSAARNIAFDQALQYTTGLKTELVNIRNTTPNTVLNTLQSSLASGAPDPYIIVMTSFDKKLGHAVLPYAAKVVSANQTDVYIYDSNYPNDSDRRIIFNPSSNTWSYNLGSSIGTWGGDSSSQTIGIIPLSRMKQKPVGFASETPNGPDSSIVSGTEVWATGVQDIWVSNTSGQRLGVIGNTLVNEIPGATLMPELGGMGVYSTPVMDLPSGGDYVIFIDGTSGPVSNATITQIGSGFFAQAENVSVSNTGQDVFNVSSDGSQMTYAASEPKQVDLTLGVNLTGGTGTIQVTGLPVTVGHTTSLVSSPQTSSFKLNAGDLTGDSYGLNLRIGSASGIDWFYNPQIQIDPLDSQTIQYGGWDGTELTILVDHGNNGTIDETLKVENQAPRFYFPIVRR